MGRVCHQRAAAVLLIPKVGRGWPLSAGTSYWFSVHVSTRTHVYGHGLGLQSCKTLQCSCVRWQAVHAQAYVHANVCMLSGHFAGKGRERNASRPTTKAMIISDAVVQSCTLRLVKQANVPCLVPVIASWSMLRLTVVSRQRTGVALVLGPEQ